MGLNWNEIKSRALLFSKNWDDACNENSQAKPFWIDFFEIFGVTNKRVATFELHVKLLGGKRGFMDLFWPGMLLVEHKSRGEDLDKALTQALGYLHHLKEHELPQLVVMCDFARFRLHRLATGETVSFELKHLHKHIKQFGLLAGYKLQDIRAEDPVNIKAAERMGRLHDTLTRARCRVVNGADDAGLGEGFVVFHEHQRGGEAHDVARGEVFACCVVRAFGKFADQLFKYQTHLVVGNGLGVQVHGANLLHHLVEQVGVVQQANKFGELEVVKNRASVFGKALDVALQIGLDARLAQGAQVHGLLAGQPDITRRNTHLAA